jgi:DNA-binding transcriptional regulator YiaG
MNINKIISAFDALRLEVIEARPGILIRQKKELRDMLGNSKSGRHVNASISYELRRRGIVHFPKDIPMSQSSIVMLTMRGSLGERQLAGIVDAIREDSSEASHQDGAPFTRSRRSTEEGISVTDRLPQKKQICSECGQEYSVEETFTASPGYWDRPYNYSQAFPTYCLACWLGVGPKDVAKTDAEHAKQSMSTVSSPPSAQWLKSQMAELGLTTRMFAVALGVADRTVKLWETKGLPIHGTGAQMVKLTLEKLFREREAHND